MKRLLDLWLSTLILLVTVPLTAGIAIAIRIVMGKPVLFTQWRAGRGGRPFRLLKFRTMTVSDQPWDPATDATRLVPLGRWLRRWSLDELPQLWNVIKGDISLVGPRPLPVEYLPRYSAQQARRHLVHPGITGLAQINGRNATTWAERLAFDVAYVEQQSFWLDMKILFRTVRLVLHGGGIDAPGQATMPEFTGR